MIDEATRVRIAKRPFAEFDKVFNAAPYFSGIKAGHGSTHNSCVVKGCRYREDHFQDPAEAAEQWLVKNGKIPA